jgi:hypothetical protein
MVTRSRKAGRGTPKAPAAVVSNEPNTEMTDRRRTQPP